MKYILHFIAVMSVAIIFTSCVGDDIVVDRVAEDLRITNAIDTIGFGSVYKFETRYLDNVGERQEVEVEWMSSDPSVISITDSGLAEGVESGSVIITAAYQGVDDYLQDQIEVVVGDNTTEVDIEEIIKEGTIVTTSSYQLEGDFIVKEIEGNLVVEVASNYKASTSLPGLFVYLSNNPNSIGGAFEVSAVSTFNGEHTYTIPDVGIDDYKYLLYFCKPFNIKVGDGSY